MFSEGFPSEGDPTVFRSNGSDKNWIKIELQGTKSNRDAIGACLEVRVRRDVIVKEVYAGSSIAVTDSTWQTIGLGKARRSGAIRVKWPSGLLERFRGVKSGQRVTLVEGSGRRIRLKKK